MSTTNELYTMISDYKENRTYRDSFNELADQIFGIEFEQFYQRGYWDENYVCHSILFHDKVVANVSVSMMDVTIDGSARKAIQIGTVMTHPDHRGKGLSGRLMNHVLELYKDDCDLFFLFANGSVHEFYPKYGFQAVQESRFTMAWAGEPLADRSHIRRLDVANDSDLALMKRMLLNRQPVSDRFGVSHNLGIFMFYALLVYPDSIELIDDKAIVVYQQERETLHVYDVVSLEKIDLEELLPHIANEQTRHIEFHFTPDRLINDVIIEPIPQYNDLMFIKTNSNSDRPRSAFCAPKLAHA